MPKRQQFRTLLKCSRCGATGHAIWEENAGSNAAGPMGELISMTENFVVQTTPNHQGQPVIACTACGTVHPD